MAPGFAGALLFFPGLRVARRVATAGELPQEQATPGGDNVEPGSAETYGMSGGSQLPAGQGGPGLMARSRSLVLAVNRRRWYPCWFVRRRVEAFVRVPSGAPNAARGKLKGD